MILCYGNEISTMTTKNSFYILEMFLKNMLNNCLMFSQICFLINYCKLNY